MEKLASLVAYICINFKHKSRLSKARVTKMIYLADWNSARRHGRQITHIHWLFNHHGPYVDDVKDIVMSDPHFRIEKSTNVYGSEKEVIILEDSSFRPDLSEVEKKYLDEVIKVTENMLFNSFIRHVYKTYPVRANTKYSMLNLVKLAEEENALLGQAQHGRHPA